MFRTLSITFVRFKGNLRWSDSSLVLVINSSSTYRQYMPPGLEIITQRGCKGKPVKHKRSQRAPCRASLGGCGARSPLVKTGSVESRGRVQNRFVATHV